MSERHAVEEASVAEFGVMPSITSLSESSTSVCHKPGLSAMFNLMNDVAE